MKRLLACCCACVFSALLTPVSNGDEHSAISKHIAAGEYRQAKQRISSLDESSRRQFGDLLAQTQAATGDLISAASSPYQSTETASSLLSGSAGAAGGGAIADFDSLMELIQTTVVPDTWEALGGPSTMSPYAAGVMIDPTGLIRDVERLQATDGLAQLRADALLASAEWSQQDWRRPAKLRKVSLGRLARAIQQRLGTGQDLSSVIRHLAGLSKIQYVVLDREHNDIIVAGTVGGIRVADDGSVTDAQSGHATLDLDALGIALRSLETREVYGCTIEPTDEGLRRTLQVRNRIASGDLPIAAASQEMEKALGRQEIRVFGTDPTTQIALLMIQADRHMKQLALGEHPMPAGVDNYLDIVRASLAEGPLTGDMLRLWFAPKTLTVRCDQDQQVFELAGTPMQLKSEQEISRPDGRRFQAAPDIRAQRFAAEFNKHLQDISRKYPMYDRLRGFYELAAVAQLMKLYLPSDTRQQVTGCLEQPAVWVQMQERVPRFTESLAVYRRFRVRNKIHSILVVSGGVQVNPAETLPVEIATYPTLASVWKDQPRSKRQDRWWWD